MSCFLLICKAHTEQPPLDDFSKPSLFPLSHLEQIILPLLLKERVDPVPLDVHGQCLVQREQALTLTGSMVRQPDDFDPETRFQIDHDLVVEPELLSRDLHCQLKKNLHRCFSRTSPV